MGPVTAFPVAIRESKISGVAGMGMGRVKLFQSDGKHIPAPEARRFFMQANPPRNQYILPAPPREKNWSGMGRLT